MTKPSVALSVWELCKNGDQDALKNLIQNNPDLVHNVDESQNNLLHIVSSKNMVEMAEFLIEKGTNINGQNFMKETPLMIGIKNKNDEITKLLIDESADVNLINTFGESCLHYSVFSFNSFAASILVRLNNSGELLMVMDANGNTALHSAALVNAISVTKIICATDYSKNILEMKNINGKTPFLLALESKSHEVTEFLRNNFHESLKHVDNEGNTVLHLASVYNDIDSIPLLLDRGVNIDNVNKCQETALHSAIKGNNVEIVEIFLRRNPNLYVQDNYLFTPLMLASKGGNYEIVKLLLNKMKDVMMVDGSNRTCLDIAIDENHSSVAELLIKSKYGRDLLRHCSTTLSGYQTTPFRKLIKKMPDIATVALDTCINDNKYPVNHPMYCLDMNFDILEDIYSSWGSSLKYSTGGSRQTKKSNIEKIRACFGQAARDIYVDYPLNLMVKEGRLNLLQHRLVSFFLKYKWRNSGLYYFITHFILITLHLILLTGFAFNIRTQTIVTVAGSCYIDKEKLSSEKFFFLAIGPIILLVLCLLDIINKTFCILWEQHSSFLRYIFELFSSFMTILFIIGGLYGADPNINLLASLRCNKSLNSIGAVSLITSFACYILFMKKLPNIGVYVVMYFDILITFLYLLPLYLMFCLAFGMAFILIAPQRAGIITDSEYFTFYSAIFMDTVNGLDYTNYVDGSNGNFEQFGMMLASVFTICNTIVLMNMLVGLAVEDITVMKATAKLKQKAQQVELAMGVQAILPHSVNEKRPLLFEKVEPNKSNNFSVYKFFEIISGFKSEKIEKELSDLDYIKQNQQLIKDQLDHLDNLLHNFIAKLDK